MGTMQEINTLSMPPHSIEAEHAVLGGLLIDNESWDLIAGTLKESDFYLLWNRQIFNAISELASKNLPFDLVTVDEHISKTESENKQKDQERFSYIAELCTNTPSTANIEVYRDIVREKSLLPPR